MENAAIAIEALKKVSLAITAGTSAETTDLITTQQPLEFIFGIGSCGLTEFEYALAGKQAGDSGAITFEAYNRAEVFGHILPCEVQSKLTTGRNCVQYRITGVSDATPTEVVRSMAAAVGGCGDGCDCGCGCGEN